MFYKIKKHSNKDYKGHLLMVLLLCTVVLSGCFQAKGYVIIHESLGNDSFTITYDQWSREDKCELIMKKGDDIRIRTNQESGSLKVSIYGKNGQEAYMGKIDDDMDFRVTIPESDTYIIHFDGNNATGVLKVDKAFN